MDRPEQFKFVKELSDSILAKIYFKIGEGKFPENWGGHEFRQYLADCFKDANFVKMEGKRKRNYINTVVVNNL